MEFSVKHNNTKEEMADVLELVETILKLKGWSRKEIAKIQLAKRKRNGGFKKRIIMLKK